MNNMKSVLTIKSAILNYFSENAEIKIRRSVAIMIPIIVIGAFIAWYVNNK